MNRIRSLTVGNTMVARRGDQKQSHDQKSSCQTMQISPVSSQHFRTTETRVSVEMLLSQNNANMSMSIARCSSLPTINRNGHKSTTKNLQLGDYLVGDTLGRGRYSVVRLAKHYITGELVALKSVGKDKLTKEDIRVLRREMQIMKLLDHPQIVKLYEVIDTPTHFHLVLEYVKGKALTDELQRFQKLRPHPREKVARQLFTELIGAVAYCHGMCVVHRDIKPDNLLLTEQGHVKLADWGFSNTSTSMLHTHCGTPYYASPELFRPKDYNGPPSDVWACGVLLYAVYCGRLPFNKEPIREYISQGRFYMPKDVPANLANLITRMLTVDPNKRITVDDIMKHPWMVAEPESLNKKSPQRQMVEPKVRRQDDEIMPIMLLLGFSQQEVHDALNDHLYNQAAATYFLLRDSLSFDSYSRLLTPSPTSSRPNHARSTSCRPAKPVNARVRMLDVDSADKENLSCSRTKSAEAGSERYRGSHGSHGSERFGGFSKLRNFFANGRSASRRRAWSTGTTPHPSTTLPSTPTHVSPPSKAL